MKSKSLLPFVVFTLTMGIGCGSKSFTGTPDTSNLSSTSSQPGPSSSSPSSGATSSVGTLSAPNPIAIPAPVNTPAPVVTPAPVASVPPSAPPPQAQGNAIIGSAGQHLIFVNGAGRPLGQASTAPSGNNADVEVQLRNPVTGRVASVTVDVDPTTGQFLAVKLSSAQPYMCHDPAADPCAIYTDATTKKSEINCESPIYFHGALNGSVNDIKQPAHIICQSARLPVVAPPHIVVPVCEVTIASGEILHPRQPVKELCQAICRDYASDSTICKFNGEVIPYGYND